jgi:hypothetical protein
LSIAPHDGGRFDGRFRVPGCIWRDLAAREGGTIVALPGGSMGDAVMMMQTGSTRCRPATWALRTVVVVTDDPDDRALETVVDAGDFDLVIVESLDGAYSKVKRVQPNLVIVSLSIDDPLAFHVLSMLKLDDDTSKIPVLTCATSDERPESSSRLPATWMN